jgi:hypothetical protein
MIADNLRQLKERISRAAHRAGRDPSEIRIVGAAKSQSAEKIREAAEAGLSIIGQNYVQEAEKIAQDLNDLPLQAHMIGPLQKNKVGKAIALFDVIETIDNEKLAETVSRRAEAIGRSMGVMIQVNLSGEPQKSGLPREEVQALAETIRRLPALQLMGLMTMPPFFDDPDRARPYFAQLRELRDELIDAEVLRPDMKELSMGMTGDFEPAVEEGATLVRIGTALFGPR